MESKVVITGMDMITSLGLSLQDCWENIVSGRSGVGRITLFDPSASETKFAAQVPEGFEELAARHIKKRSAEQMTRVSRMGCVCAKSAVADSGIDFGSVDRSRCAVILGVVNTGFSSVEQKRSSKQRILKNMNNAMSAWISLEYKLEGPNFTVTTACSSSAYAAGLGYDWIRQGRADVVIVGGSDSIVNPEEVAGFNELYALSVRNEAPEKACRPFTAGRDGFVIGEGAGMLVLESEESARRRGARIYAELAGYAVTSEAYNIMSRMRDGEGMARTMELALKASGVSPGEIDYINAHGTSTPLNDRYETMAIKKVFGERARAIPISASKSMIGHTIGAAGAVEGIITVMSIVKGVVPPTINYDTPDPELDLDYVPNKARRHDIRAAMSNSFAFGGHNAALVFRRYAAE